MALFAVQERSGALVVQIQVPRLDMMMYRRFRDEMKVLLEARPERIIVDLELTNSLDSSAVGVLKKSLDEAQAYGGRLILCNVGKPIISILRLAHMEKIFESADTLEEALHLGMGPSGSVSPVPGPG